MQEGCKVKASVGSVVGHCLTKQSVTFTCQGDSEFRKMGFSGLGPSTTVCYTVVCGISSHPGNSTTQFVVVEDGIHVLPCKEKENQLQTKIAHRRSHFLLAQE